MLKKFRENLFTVYIFNVLLIIGIVVALMGIMVERIAVDAEALVNFQYMQELNLGEIWIQESVPGHFTTYRPITVSLIRLEFLLFGITPPLFFITNIVLLCFVALLINFIIYQKTKTALPALIAALLFISDWRVTPNIYVIGEVQSTLAALFGLSAFIVAWNGKRRYSPVIVFFLLLGAALCKEFGLAFSLGILIFSLFKTHPNWKHYLGSAIGSVGIYSLLRILLNTLPTSSNGPTTFANSIKWMIYNISNGFTFTFFPLFRTETDGELPSILSLRFPPQEAWLILILQIIPIIIFFIFAYRDKEKYSYTVPLFFVIIGNSILFFFKYAYRFHFLGNVAMYILVGFGLSYIFTRMSEKSSLQNWLILLFMYCTAIIAWRADSMHDYLTMHREWTERAVLCIPTNEYYEQENFRGHYTGIDKETIIQVMEYYEMPLDECTCLDPTPICW